MQTPYAASVSVCVCFSGMYPEPGPSRAVSAAFLLTKGLYRSRPTVPRGSLFSCLSSAPQGAARWKEQPLPLMEPRVHASACISSFKSEPILRGRHREACFIGKPRVPGTCRGHRDTEPQSSNEPTPPECLTPDRRAPAPADSDLGMSRGGGHTLPLLQPGSRAAGSWARKEERKPFNPSYL